jgi:predicted nucleotidyltransferase
MAKLTVEDFARQVADALGGRLVALLLYGSAARGTHTPGRSDVNTLLISKAVDDALFASLEGPVRAWTRDAGHPAPLVLTEQEWRASADAFPIEYEEMRDAHRLLAGRDPWQGIVVKRDDMRRQLEYELLAKLVRLRQAYAASWSEPRRLTEAVAGSAAGLLTMLRSVLRLSGVTPPAAPDALVREAAARIGFAASVLDDVLAYVRGERRLALEKHDARAVAYLDVVARTTEFVNRLT